MNHVILPGTAEWTAARATGIGASEIAVAAGLSRYSTPLELYLRKTGELPEWEGNVATRLGTKLEPIIVSEFTEQSGIEVKQYPAPMMRHPKYDFLFATPDALLADDEGLECKSTSFQASKNQWGEELTDEIPTEYLCQCQMGMAVTGYGCWHVACLVDGRHLRCFVVFRNDALIEQLIDAAHELWKRIQSRQPPEPDYDHASTLPLLQQMHREISLGEIVKLSGDARATWGRYEELGEQIKKLQSQRDACKARILDELEDGEAGDLGDGFVIRRKEIVKEPYTVTPKPYVDVRKVKAASFFKG